MKESNPFNTTFGREPDNMVARIEEQEKIIRSFSMEKPSEHTYIITGQRGSGKTVLLSTIYNHFKNDKGWVVVDPGPKDNIIENLAAVIYETGKVKKLFAEAEFSFSFQGIGISLKGKTPVSSAFVLLTKMLDHLKKKGKRLLITIDEVDNSEQMRYFVQGYQSLIRQEYPIFLLMTGLYGNIHKLEEEKSLTFLYRAQKIVLGPLSIAAIAFKYGQYLGTTRQESTELAKLTKGYAYAYQVLGYLLYEKGDNTVDQPLLTEFDHYMSDYVYQKIYSELSMKEKEIISCFKTPLPVEVSKICEAIKQTSNYLSPYRDSLIKSGILVSPSYGYLQLALPRFEEFLAYMS